MMDTEQFDGHTPGPWSAEYGSLNTLVWVQDGGDDIALYSVTPYEGDEVLDVDAELIAAAPDLLAEVKRLRAALTSCLWYAENDGRVDFPLHDIIEVCDWALNDEGDEEE